MSARIQIEKIRILPMYFNVKMHDGLLGQHSGGRKGGGMPIFFSMRE